MEYDERDGSRYAVLVRPLASVGAYVPGGTASLPSSAIMTTVPAKLAGVERVVVATPPCTRRRRASIRRFFSRACCAASTSFTPSAVRKQSVRSRTERRRIAPVDKIVGPGSVWVTEAKRQVFGVVGIDGLAGPSEVLVVADESSQPEFVAGEMLAQAEHDPYARVATVSSEPRRLGTRFRRACGVSGNGTKRDRAARLR